MTEPRVALVTGRATGGMARHVAMLSNGCARAGLRITVYGLGVRLVRDLATAPPDVVHAHGVRAGAFAALVTGARRRPALVVTVHNAPPHPIPAAIAYRVLERICARRADLVLCVSTDLEDRMRRARARRTAPAVIAAPTAPAPTNAQVAACRAELRAGARPVVLGAGRLTAQKGFDLLLRAALGWRARTPPPLLVIAGDGPARRLLTRYREQNELNAALIGYRTDIAAMLAASDVVVVPSRWDGQPMLVAEALRAGRPLVATRVGGIPALTGEDAALLVPPGDVAALSAAVESVLDDPGLRARLAAAARVRAACIPAETDAVNAAIQVYRRLAGGGGSRERHLVM